METPLRSSILSFENLPLPPRSWWLERGLTRAHHRSIDTMRAHLRSCIVPEKQFMALVDACRTRSWLFMFHLRLIEGLAPCFRCDARVFLPRFVALRRRSSTALGLGKELHGLLRGLMDRVVLQEIFSCSGRSCTPRCMAPSSHGGARRGHDRRDRADEAHSSVHLASTADPSCAESARHATLRGLSTRPHFSRRMGMSTSQASRGSRPSLVSSTQLRISRDGWWYAHRHHLAAAAPSKREH